LRSDTEAPAVPPSPGEQGGLRSTLTALRGAQKTPRGVSWYSLLANRPAGRYLAAVAHVLGLTPDAVTGLSALASGSGAALLLVAPSSLPVSVLVAVLLALGFALDSADGQLARLQGSGGTAGEWLDHVVDCAVKLLLHGLVLVAWYRAGVRGALLLVPLAFQSVTVLLFVAGTLAGLLLGRPVERRAAPGRRDAVSRWVLLPVDHGVLCWSFVLWSWTGLFRGWYAVLLVVQALALVVLCAHWRGQLSRRVLA
jgi:phosphatidylglycerophosphate synthase